MKKNYIKDVLKYKTNRTVLIAGWIQSIRKYGGVSFINLVDSTSSIQVILDKKYIDKATQKITPNLKSESAISVLGVIQKNRTKKEIIAKSIKIIGNVTMHLSPSPRSNFDIFSKKYTNLILSNKHIYIRNPKYMHILRMRHIILNDIRTWFNNNNFIEINAPILTPVPLYNDSSAISLKINNKISFLTQCVGFYLESSAMAFEKVYNIGPSFRKEESHSKRHLMEYWHTKAEVCFADLEDMIKTVENLIKYVSKNIKEYNPDNVKYLNKKVCLDGLKTPYPRISYKDAIRYLEEKDFDVKVGKSLGPKEEAELSRKFKGTPFWIVGNSKKVEPFPYVLETNNEFTKTADLIASNCCDELLGVAEKISDEKMLIERLKEKGKYKNNNYNWIIDVHKYACVQHSAFGMGVERLLRWLLNVAHVRDTIPYPRTFRRNIYP